MKKEEAEANIGKPFKWSLCAHWDTIRRVTIDGYIVGDFLMPPVEDCRLKQEQPPQLKKHNYENKTDRFQDDL